MTHHQSNNIYHKFEGKDFNGSIVKNSPLSAWLGQSHEPLDLLENNATVIKTDKKTRAGIVHIEVEADEPITQEIFVKEYKPRKKFRLLKLLLGQNRAPSVWNIAWHLYDHDIQIPKPYAYFVYHNGDYKGISYYCCESLKTCKMLADIAYYDKKLYGRLCRSDLFARVMDSISKIHRLGISHGDLKWSNILVNEQTLDFWFIDFDASVLRRYFKIDYFAIRDIEVFTLEFMIDIIGLMVSH